MKVLFTSIFALFLATSAWATGEMPNPASCTESDLGASEGPLNIDLVWEPNTINTTWYSEGVQIQDAPQSCSYSNTMTFPTAPSRAGYVFAGWTLHTPQCALPTSLLNADASQYGYINGSNTLNATALGLTDNMTWGISWSNGTKVTGIASCQPSAPADILYIYNNADAVLGGQMNPSTAISEYTALAGQEKGAILQQLFSDYSLGNITADELDDQVVARLYVVDGTGFSTSSTGQYCFCRATHYTAPGAQQCAFPSTPWLFHESADNTTDCANNCASWCSNIRAASNDWRIGMFGTNVTSGGNGGGGQSNDFSLATLDASIDGTAHGWLNNAQSGQNASVYGLENANTWGVSFSYGKVIGSAFCSSATGDNHSWDWGTPSSDWTGTNAAVTAAAGANCWCKGTGFIASGSSTTQNTTSSAWTFHSNYGDTSTCQSFCAGDCGNYIEGSSNLRSALFNN